MVALELRLELGLVAQQQAVGVQKRAQLLLRKPVIPRVPRRAGHLRKTATGATPVQSDLGGEGLAGRHCGDVHDGLAPILGHRLRRVTPSVGERVEARYGQPTAALLKRHEQGLRLGQ
eukprot:scaffold72237_cov73-Phaeocystis_antarctica.AAC.1